MRDLKRLRQPPPHRTESGMRISKRPANARLGSVVFQCCEFGWDEPGSRIVSTKHWTINNPSDQLPRHCLWCLPLWCRDMEYRFSTSPCRWAPAYARIPVFRGPSSGASRLYGASRWPVQHSDAFKIRVPSCITATCRFFRNRWKSMFWRFRWLRNA